MIAQTALIPSTHIPVTGHEFNFLCSSFVLEVKEISYRKPKTVLQKPFNSCHSISQKRILKSENGPFSQFLTLPNQIFYEEIRHVLFEQWHDWYDFPTSFWENSFSCHWWNIERAGTLSFFFIGNRILNSWTYKRILILCCIV